jgi:aminocarboxymuconate-semialdehyde decarboxylase
VFIHPTGCPHIDELALGRPPSVIEFPFDTARNITNAIYTGVFLRHPGLRLIVPHCGGPLPALAWRIGEHTTVAIGPQDAPITPQHVADALRSLYYDTAMAASRNSLLPLLEVTSFDHILFGTDYPAAPEATIARTIDQLTTNLTGQQLRSVEQDNARKLFPRLS